MLSEVRLGLVINPYAGVGGPAALKGSDASSTQLRVQRGDLPLTVPNRLARYFDRLYACLEQSADNKRSTKLSFLTGTGVMDALQYSKPSSTYAKSDDLRLSKAITFNSVLSCDLPSKANDTRALVSKLAELRVDAILFVGGDGTARDIAAALKNNGADETIPVLGIPAGVKMHSGVFALSPEAAAQITYRFVCAELIELVEQEVRDLDEQRYRQGDLSVKYFASLLTLTSEGFNQSEKQSESYSAELDFDDIAADIDDRMREIVQDTPDTLFIFGAGTTTRHILSYLKLPSTLLGVDAVKFCQKSSCFSSISLDVDAFWLEKKASSFARVVLIVSPTGGQGFLFGRGNQQISSSFLSYVDQDSLLVVCLREKLLRLDKRPLLVDLDDVAATLRWAGARPIITGYKKSTLYPIRSA